MRAYLRLILTIRILWELVRYELVFALTGFRSVHRGLRRQIRRRNHREAVETAICQAVEAVTSFHWKRVLCLERSVITARVMHAYGIAAEVVIGYRFTPFAGHAWVEVDGHVVNDSTGYADKMHVLERVRPAVATGQNI